MCSKNSKMHSPTEWIKTDCWMYDQIKILHHEKNITAKCAPWEKKQWKRMQIFQHLVKMAITIDIWMLAFSVHFIHYICPLMWLFMKTERPTKNRTSTDTWSKQAEISPQRRRENWITQLLWLSVYPVIKPKQKWKRIKTTVKENKHQSNSKLYFASETAAQHSI